MEQDYKAVMVHHTSSMCQKVKSPHIHKSNVMASARQQIHSRDNVLNIWHVSDQENKEGLWDGKDAKKMIPLEVGGKK